MVTFDKEFAEAILSKINETNTISKKNFKQLEKRLQYLASLSKVITMRKFISKRDKMRIDTQLSKIKNSVDFKLRSHLSTLDGSENKEEFRNDFFDLIGIEDKIQDFDPQDD